MEIMSLDTLKAEFDKDALAYLKSHDRAEAYDIVQYLETIEAPGVITSAFDKGGLVQKYRQLLTPIETYLNTKKHLQALVNAQRKERNLEDYDAETDLERSAIKKYMLEFCAVKLLEPDNFVYYTCSQLEYFLVNKSALTVPFNAETAFVAEKLVKKNITDPSPTTLNLTLKWLQQFSLAELTEQYRLCSGPAYTVLKKNGVYSVIPNIVNSQGQKIIKVKV
jgi:hypothetical protein